VSTIGNLVVNFAGQTQQFDRASSKVTKTLGRMKTAAIGFAGVFGGMFVVRDFVSVGQEQIRSITKLNSVLEATGNAAGLSGKEIADYAAELQKTTNFTDEMTIDAAAMLATFKNIRGDRFKEVLSIAQDMSAVFKQDLKASILQVGKAFDDPIRGAASLREVGVSLSDAETNRIRQLQEQGDLLGAQQVLMDALTTQVGGAAQKMSTPLERFSNLLNTVKETIGIILIDFIESGLALYEWENGITSFSDQLKDVGLAVKRLAVFVTDIFRNIGDLLGVLFANALHNIEALRKPLAKILSGELPSDQDMKRLGESLVSPLDGFEFRMTDPATITMKDVTGGAAGAVPTMIPPTPVTPEAEEKDDALASAIEQKDEQFAAAATKGSQEAFSSILNNQFRKATTVNGEIKKNTKEMVNKLDRTNILLERNLSPQNDLVINSLV
jgi:hypothetical protein